MKIEIEIDGTWSDDDDVVEVVSEYGQCLKPLRWVAAASFLFHPRWNHQGCPVGQFGDHLTKIGSYFQTF